MDRIKEVIEALAEKRFISPQPENNLTRAREWVRQHQKEVDIICQLFPQPLGDKELWEGVRELYCIDLCGSKGAECIPEAGGYCRDATNHADKTLALLQPKIEEAREQARDEIDGVKSALAELNKKLDDREDGLIVAKREERERIMGVAEKHYPRIRAFAEWQALKGGE